MCKWTSLLLVMLLGPHAAVVAAADTVHAGESRALELENEARALAREFVGQLRPRLQQAMAEGGPAHAIEICAGVAPRIADSLSADSGWSVRRVSLNPRNASRAVPDPWERRVLESFDARRMAGEAPGTLEYAEETRGRYRYMQAQVVEGICLTCHGADLPAAARATLSEYYPDDAATGYGPGEVRGAISLSKQITH